MIVAEATAWRSAAVVAAAVLRSALKPNPKSVHTSSIWITASVTMNTPRPSMPNTRLSNGIETIGYA